MDATSLAYGALLVAAGAFVLAARARSLARRAGMAVRRLEARGSAERPAGGAASGVAAEAVLARWEEVADGLRRRVALLEEHSARPLPPEAAPVAVPPAPAPPAAPPPLSASVRVRRHLEAEGYRDVELVALGSEAGAFVVEARKDGATLKGRAVVDGEGRVTARVAPALRAFP